MKEQHLPSWYNMISFHDQDHLYDNNQSAPYKAGHVRLKHSQETEIQVPSVMKRCRKEAKKQTLEFKRQPFL